MGEVIYLRDVLKDKTPEEILKMLPFMVCIETIYNETNEIDYKSYDVLGVSPTGLILRKDIYVEVDDYAFTPYSREHSYITIDLDKLENKTETYPNGYTVTTNYVFCHRATEKQMNFLLKYCDCDYVESDDVSGYEAYIKIKEKTEQWEKNKKNRANKHYDVYDYYYDEEDDLRFDYLLPNR